MQLTRSLPCKSPCSMPVSSFLCILLWPVVVQDWTAYCRRLGCLTLLDRVFIKVSWARGPALSGLTSRPRTRSYFPFLRPGLDLELRTLLPLESWGYRYGPHLPHWWFSGTDFSLFTCVLRVWGTWSIFWYAVLIFMWIFTSCCRLFVSLCCALAANYVSWWAQWPRHL